MVRTLLLIPHIAAGATGLLLGPLAMRAPKQRGRHTQLGRAYQAATAVLCATAVGMALLDFGALWWLGLIGVATEAAALGGWWTASRRFRGWLPVHLQLMCGSYISFVTAFLVVNWSSPIAWVLPTIIGSPLIALATARVTVRGAPAVRS
jgi:hypothetical protein